MEKKSLSLVVGLLLVLCMLSGIASAAIITPPSTSGTSSQLKPEFNLNVPAKGTITITAPAGGTTWYQNESKRIEWTCSGTVSNQVEVTLWQNDKQEAAIASSSTGHAAYTVPRTIAPGAYELRVTGQDTRVEARLPVTVGATTLTVSIDKSVNDLTVKWIFTGNVGATVKIVQRVTKSDGKPLHTGEIKDVIVVDNYSSGQNGAGQYHVGQVAIGTAITFTVSSDQYSWISDSKGVEVPNVKY